MMLFQVMLWLQGAGVAGVAHKAKQILFFIAGLGKLVGLRPEVLLLLWKLLLQGAPGLGVLLLLCVADRACKFQSSSYCSSGFGALRGILSFHW